MTDEEQVVLSREQINERQAFVERNRYLWITDITNHVPAADGTFKATIWPSNSWGGGGCFATGEADVDANGDIVRITSQPITMWMASLRPKPIQMQSKKEK